MQSLISKRDFFVTVPPIQSLETLTFLQLPVPQVSPSPPPISAFSDLLFLCIGSAFEVSLRIDRFPVEAGLSKFIADVFPREIDFCVEDFEVEARLSEETQVLNEEKDVAGQSTSGSEAAEIEVSKKRKGQAVDDKLTQRHKLMQFETPQLEELAENASFFVSEGIQILSKAPEIEGSLERLQPGLATHYSCEVVKSFLLVEDITFEYPMEEKTKDITFEYPMEEKTTPEDDCSFQDHFQFNLSGFPTLEVDETVLDSVTGFAAEEKFLSYFEIIEPPDFGNDNLLIEDKENWGRKEYGISGLLSDHFLSGPSFGSELGSLDNFQDADLIGLVEMSQIGMKYEVQGTSDGDRFLSDQPLVFQEFHVLDMDSAKAFEALFSSQRTYEPDTISRMFNEDTNFKNFNNLIVSHELTLVDDTFKSLPIPVICDRVKLKSFNAIIDGKLASLKPHPTSALDEIYLDWHLLEEDKHNCHAYYHQSIVRDMVAHNIEFDWDSLGDKNVLDEFLLSDDSMNGLNKEENREQKEFLSGVSIPVGVTMEGESSGKFLQSDNGEQFAWKNSERASYLFKSMSRSNDLDFFLNAKKATTGTNSKIATGAANKKPTSPKATLGISVAAIPQGGQSIAILNNDGNVNQQEFFDDISVEERYDMGAENAMGKVESHSVGLSIPSMPFAKESKHPHGNLVSLPQTLILVNTQNLDKEMIVSRRSSYQIILAIEKEGAQVVERDSDLPVDIVINSAACLVWYNRGNIGKKATSLDEASSSLPLCIENIATNVLTLLSFNFSGCIMVFEGDNSFLSTVMEFSDELYAAVASLGIDVQLFYSYSSESTDEIIMSCIQYAKRGVYPRMSESETLAESFLTKFPSINPLTAHAILSSGAMLSEFLEWSNERRIHAIQKYHVPHESIALLSALCKYGEREDSRSSMTDCSSSVSSGTDSKSFNLNTASKRKRWMPDGSLKKSGAHMNDSLHLDPVKQSSRDTTVPSTSVQKSYDSFMSKDPETSRAFRNPRIYNSSLFREELYLDATQMMDPSGNPKPHDFQACYEPQMFKKIRKPEFSFGDKLPSQLQRSDEAMLKIFDHVKGSQILFEDQKGEVIDLTGSPRSGKRLSSIDDSIFLMPELENDARGKSKAARRLSFGTNHQTTFPTTTELFSEKNIWNSAKDQGRTFEVGANRYSDIDFGENVSIMKHHNHNQPLEESFNQRSTESSRGMSFKENESLHFGGTLKNALSFSSPGKNSPWTMEFLNKIRDKSRLRHQSLPCDTSATFGLPGNISKDFKRSPSIIEFFKCKGGNTKRVPEQKKQKRSVQSAGSSKVEKRSASACIQSTWTPLDKRARQSLSFTTNTGERQTKLIWNDGTRNRSNKFQNQI